MTGISSLNTRIDNIKHINDIQQQQAEIHSITKTLKRCAKRETSLTNFRDIEAIFNKLQEASQQIETFPHSSLSSLGKQLQERRDLLESRSKFYDNDEKLPFDQFLRKTRLSHEVKKTITSIVQKLQLKNEPITSNDMMFLVSMKTYPFEEFLSQIKTSISESIERKNSLISMVLQMSDDPDMTESQNKLKKYVLLKQIMGNPLEFPVESELLAQYEDAQKFLEGCEAEKIVKDGKIPYTEETLKFKTEGLKLIKQVAVEQMNTRDQTRKKILISGFGPGGLTAGLFSTVQGHDITIIEKRKQDDHKRENVLALGKESLDQHLPMLRESPKPGNYNQADLRILDFFGVTDYLVTQKLVNLKEGTPWQNIAIGDLQNAMLSQLEQIVDQVNEENPLVQYGTTIQEIQNTGDETHILLSDGLTPKVYDNVIVMEGARSSTRTLLGIDVHKHSKAARMALSFFKVQETKPGTLSKAARNLSLFFKMIPLAFKLMWHKRTSTNEYDLVAKAWGRGLLVLKTPSTDYGYATLTDDEEQMLNECEEARTAAEASRDEWADKIADKLAKFNSDGWSPEAQGSISFLRDAFKNDNRKKWFTNKENMNLVFKYLKKVMVASGEISDNAPNNADLEAQFQEIVSKIKQLESDYESTQEIIKKEVQSGMPTMNVAIDTMFGVGQRSTEHIKTFFASSQVTQAEKSMQRVGSTTFYIGGDAASTTDPVSGSGARTTMLGVALTLPILNSSYGNTPIATSLCEWTNHLRSRSMREEGLEMRSTYRQGTERLERFTEIGVDVDVISRGEASFLLKLSAQKKSGIPIDPKNNGRIEEITSRILEKRSTGIKFLTLLDKDKKTDLKTLKKKGCTSKEAAVYYSVCKSIHDGNKTSLNENDKILFWNAAAKIAKGRFSLLHNEISNLNKNKDGTDITDEEQIKAKLSVLSLSSDLTEKIFDQWKKCHDHNKRFYLSSSIRKEIASLVKSRIASSDFYYNEAWVAPLIVVLDDLLPKTEEASPSHFGM